MRAILVVLMAAACGDAPEAHDEIDCGAFWGPVSQCERACASTPSAGIDVNADGVDDTCRLEGAECTANRVALSEGQRGCCAPELRPGEQAFVIRFKVCE